jgi:hypothetical protein
MAVSGTHVRSSIHVTARSFVYLANEINRVFLEAIIGFGLDPGTYVESMPVIENGLRTWVVLRQLEAVYLEVYDKQSGKVRTRIDLTVEFRQSGDDTRYETDIESVRQAVTQAGSYAGSAYRVVATTAQGAAQVAGWSDTTLGAVDHLSRHDVGGVIDAPRMGETREMVTSPAGAVLMEVQTGGLPRSVGGRRSAASGDFSFPAVSGTWTAPITIYLSDEVIHEQVEAAVEVLLASAGLRIEERDEPRIGSWFRKMRAGVKAGVESPAGREAMLTATHILDSRLTLGQDANITATLLLNLAPVLHALQPTKDAVIRVGALLIVKVDWTVQTFQLTAAQQAFLDHQPQLATRPHEIMAALQLSDADSEPLPPAQSLGERPNPAIGGFLHNP